MQSQTSNNQKTRLKLAVITLAITIYGIMMTLTIPNVLKFSKGLQIIDLEPFGYSSMYVNNFLTVIGSEGRVAYLFQLTLDFFYPLLFGLSCMFIISYLIENKGFKRYSIVKYLPLLASLFDYLENISLVYLIIKFPLRNSLLEGVLPIFTMLKSIFSTSSFTIIIILVIHLLVTFYLMKFKYKAENVI